MKGTTVSTHISLYYKLKMAPNVFVMEKHLCPLAKLDLITRELFFPNTFLLSVSLLSLSLCPCSCRRPTSCGFSVSGPYLAELCGAQSGSCWELLWRYCCWCWLTHTRDTWSVFSLLCSFCFPLARLLPRTHMCAHQINCKFSPHCLST